MLARAHQMKAAFKKGDRPEVLAGKTLAVYFEKPSLRTRMSFETAMTQLGGHAMLIGPQEVGLGSRESVPDVARVISRMVDAITARTFSHEVVVELAKFSSVPVINALTDDLHPCQAMADMMTVQEKLGHQRGKTLTFIGDGNNVARSLAMLCGKLGMNFVLGCPAGYEFDAVFLDQLAEQGCAERIRTCNDPAQAVAGAEVLYTDVWTSMGQEAEHGRRLRDFSGYQLNAALVSRAASGALIMHCLPAHRGEEITGEVMDGPGSIIFDQAENRLHLQKALLAVVCEAG